MCGGAGYIRRGLIVRPAVSELDRVALLDSGDRAQGLRQIDSQLLSEIQQRGRIVLACQPGRHLAQRGRPLRRVRRRGEHARTASCAACRIVSA